MKYLLLFALVTGCSSSGIDLQGRINKLQKGQPAGQVIVILGNPDKKSLSNGIEKWEYQNTHFVEFTDEKVSGFGEIQQVNGQRVELRSKNLGEKCNSDEECSSGLCHLWRCSGKNFCTVSLGGVCAQNSDCCEGICDFGNCKKTR